MYINACTFNYFIFKICSASAVQSAVCMRVDTAGPSLVWDYMTGL